MVGILEARVSQRYSDLSDKLRTAADYIVANPVEIATRSLRSVSASSEVSPATFSRLARALGFESYEALRDVSRGAVDAQIGSFAEKAAELQDPQMDHSSILSRQAGACMSNIAALSQTIDANQLAAAVRDLSAAKRVAIFGAFGSLGMAEYLAYLASFFKTDWRLASRAGTSLAATLDTLGPDDALIVITKTPYARRAVLAAKMARANGVSTLILTDSHKCPATAFGKHIFVVPSDSPQFFSSYAATLVLMETMVAMMVAESQDDISDKIRIIEERSERLEEFWDD